MIDRVLRNCRFPTIVHGDAKLANFCFADDGQAVAAVDFQYAGGGGIKDVAYFIGSCPDEADCERQETELLDVYFASLRKPLLFIGRSWISALSRRNGGRFIPLAGGRGCPRADVSTIGIIRPIHMARTILTTRSNTSRCERRSCRSWKHMVST